MSKFPADAIRRVCIIGAGPSGLAVARYLLAEKHFTTIDIFEQRTTIGGVWNINTKNARSTRVPSEDVAWDAQPFPLSDDASAGASAGGGSEDGPIREGEDERVVAERQEPGFDSPLYPTLETNIPHQIMAYSSLKFEDTVKVLEEGSTADPTPSGPSASSSSTSSPLPGSSRVTEATAHVPLFPPYQTVLSYLRQYSLPILPYIKFSTQVISADPIPESDQTSGLTPPLTKWSITTCHLPTSERKTSTYDALIVSNGHYTTPYLPSMPNLKEWSQLYPNTVLHSRDFRQLSDFKDRKTVVIGGSASGVDIGQQISSVCEKPLIRVIRSNNPGDNPKTYQQVSHFILPSSTPGEGDRAIEFLDTSGTPHIEINIEKIVFATGYLYTYPFFPPSLQSLLLSPGRDSHTPGQMVHDLHRHLLSIPHPTLSFLALPIKVIPFPLAEAQSAVIARLYSGRLSLPNEEEMREEEKALREKKGEGKAFHTMNWPEDWVYYNSLISWAEEASKAEGRSRANHGGDEIGAESSEEESRASEGGAETLGEACDLLPKKWNEEIKWLRKMFPEIRRRYVARGEVRRGVGSWEELGVKYECQE